MKRLIFLLLLILSFATVGCQSPTVIKSDSLPSTTASVETELFGIIKNDATISGTVKITGDVYVPPGITLTIAPGATIFVQQSDSTKVEPLFLSSNTEILVKGKIIARGEKDKKITFLSSAENAGKKEYAGIILLESKEAFFENCVFKNAQTAILAEKATLNVANCNFEYCFYAISTNNAKVEIKNSVATNCDKGFYFHRNSTGAVSSCEFDGCLEDAVFIDNTSKLDISKNVFRNNLWGVSTIEYDENFTKNNTFMNNKEDVKRLNY